MKGNQIQVIKKTCSRIATPPLSSMIKEKGITDLKKTNSNAIY